LGNLTVSPKNLGSSLILESELIFHTKIDTTIDKEVADEIEYGKHIELMNRLNDHKNNDIKLRTMQTLAPNYNEII
jgi:hypothetical protein